MGDSASRPTEAEARTVAAVKRGDPRAINSLILNGDKRRTAAYFRAGLADAVLSHFRFPEAVAARQETTSPELSNPDAIINVLVNFISSADSPWLAPIRSEIASKLQPLLRIMCEETTIWGQPQHHMKMTISVVGLISNLLLSPEEVKPVLRHVTSEDSSRSFKSFLGRALVGRWDSPLLDAAVIRTLRRGCMQIFTELVDVLPPGEDDAAKITVAGRAELKSILQAEVEAWNGGGAESTLGSEFLTMLASPQIDVELAESAQYIFQLLTLGCPEVADGDGVGGFGPLNGVEKVVRMLDVHVFSDRASQRERVLWSQHGSSFLLICLRGVRGMPDDSRTAIFISSGALTSLIKLGTRYGRQDAEVAENIMHALGMVGAVGGLKKTSKAAAAKQVELVAALEEFSRAAKGQRHMTEASIAAAALAKRFGELPGNNDGSVHQRQEPTLAKEGCSRCFKVTKDLKSCSSCRTRYCSRECQLDDWKNGGHKAFCQQKQGVTRAKDLGREAKDLAALGHSILEERKEAAALIAAIQGLSLLDCVLVVQLGGCAPRVQPLLAEEYLRDFHFEGSMTGAGASRAEEERARQHTEGIVAKNRQSKAVTAAIHSDKHCCLKTLGPAMFESASSPGAAGMAQIVLVFCRTASEMSGEPVDVKIRAVVDALRNQGMLSAEQIAAVLGCPYD